MDPRIKVQEHESVERNVPPLPQSMLSNMHSSTAYSIAEQWEQAVTMLTVKMKP